AGGRNREAVVYRLDQPLKPGEQAIDLGRLDKAVPLVNWPAALPTQTASRQGVSTAADSKEDIFRRLLFHEKLANTGQAKNISLRELDESWRVRLANEVILFGRLAVQNAPAESVTKDAVSPSRLWLGQVPGPKVTRPELPGTMTQDTYVRVFLPVQSEAAP